jgi:hypothetical protein
LSIVQCEDNPFSRTLERLRAKGIVAADVTPVTYGVFGAGGNCARLEGAIRVSPSARAEIRELGYEDPRTASASLALDYAFATNASGVVLLSMLQPDHLAMNASRAAAPPDPRVIEVVDRLVSSLNLSTRESGYQS